MVIGAAVVLFMLFKYLTRPKAVKKGEYLIRDVHVIVGDGSEAYHQNVLIRDGMIAKISDQPIGRKNVQIIEGEGKTLMSSGSLMYFTYSSAIVRSSAAAI